MKPIWILLKQETVSGSGISGAICKSAPCSRQTTTPAPYHSVFTGRMPFLPPNQQCQSTESTNWSPNSSHPNPVDYSMYGGHSNRWCIIHKITDTDQLKCVLLGLRSSSLRCTSRATRFAACCNRNAMNNCNVLTY